ncbi:MAG: alpha/beta hydrolase [Alphaproteobacteria bacterium]|nr:alpha/beta hydrolase [Alphaproteobacteria bacterium]MBU1512470.1 alpha/beta hydrolase [Alphaproteobacteria bacterium]MBU2096606.1 alpha/beta hydrolase [Alphaproteobacteria bacterium]MBU2151576.1 alpha/beta hydrolase [Alphaproteobacteria bacterium]MBU2307293.1 alpha/beta hydrolase [Alphaproteobacteria bacterium]
MTQQLRYVTANGARLAYQIHGEGSGRPSAIFVHGYSGRSTGDAYADLLPALAQVFTVYALDLRGHGASASEFEGWSLAALADDVAAVARELGLVGALYIGHSIGGFTGLFCEVRHPGTFSAMCLLTTAGAGGAGHADPNVGKLLIEQGRDPEAMRGNFAPMYVHGGDGAANVEAILLVDRSVHEAFFADYPTRVISNEIRDIDIPVLVLNGAKDIVVPLAEQHATALALPHCKEVTYMTEGHMLPRESGKLAAREIINFWTYDVPETLARGARTPTSVF